MENLYNFLKLLHFLKNICLKGLKLVSRGLDGYEEFVVQVE